MSIVERKNRQKAEREARIVTAARLLAERDGWESVTVRRLAEEIEYSQPVLYSHFANRNAIVTAVALEGFMLLESALRIGGSQTHDPKEAVTNVALAYCTFAVQHPALYEAMFVLPTDLRFAEAGSRPELRAAFEAFAAVLRPFFIDVETATESFWATLHGLAELERAKRIRPDWHLERIALIVHALLRIADIADPRRKVTRA